VPEEVLRFASLNGAGSRAVGTYSGGMMQRLGATRAIPAVGFSAWIERLAGVGGGR